MSTLIINARLYIPDFDDVYDDPNEEADAMAKMLREMDVSIDISGVTILTDDDEEIEVR